MSTDQDSRNIVETIITLAKKLGKATVAEGVETKKHQALLSEFACDYGQGYLFSKPLNSLSTEDFLKNNLTVENIEYASVEAAAEKSFENVTNQYTM